ncbi:MAG: apolipoprotein N-acyltransferase [Crocinitomicaceae bacterium]|nr:apolipoprotein N-acyltransferase [Crocinitomicaceae bacterium]
MVLAYPHSGSLTPLVFISWVPLLFVENNISSQNYRSKKVFTHAYLSFFIYNVGTTWWVLNASIGGATLAFLANSLIMTVTFYAFHLTKKYVGSKEGYLSLIIYWISFEHLHYNWEASWTWLTLGNNFAATPSWVQWYSYTGVLGGTLWILIINLLIFRIFQNVKLKKETWRIQTPLVWLTGFFLFIPLAISLYTYFSFEEVKEPKEIVVVQPNIDPYKDKFKEPDIKHLDKILTQAKSKYTEKTALVIAPETAIVNGGNEDNIRSSVYYRKLIEAQAQMNNVPIYIGAATYKFFEKELSRAAFKLSDGPGFVEQYNSSLFLNKKHEPSIIHKSKLVPGVEAIPFSNIFPFLEDLAVTMEGGSGTLGIEDGPKIFTATDFKFAPVVCYESIYGEWVAEQCRQGAQVICIITNDGWWLDTPGYRQHMSFARLRAIENRKYVARSANTGTSAIINQRGDILKSTDWWEEDVLRETIQLNSTPTFYTKYGNVLGRSLSFVTALLLLFTFVKRFKRLSSHK